MERLKLGGLITPKNPFFCNDGSDSMLLLVLKSMNQVILLPIIVDLN